MSNDMFCNWIYRPGTNSSHWAKSSCRKGFNYLSRIKNCESYIGVADYYNNKQCPVCGKPIKIDYCILLTNKEENNND